MHKKNLINDKFKNMINLILKNTKLENVIFKLPNFY